MRNLKLFEVKKTFEPIFAKLDRKSSSENKNRVYDNYFNITFFKFCFDQSGIVSKIILLRRLHVRDLNFFFAVIPRNLIKIKILVEEAFRTLWRQIFRFWSEIYGLESSHLAKYQNFKKNCSSNFFFNKSEGGSIRLRHVVELDSLGLQPENHSKRKIVN